MRKKDATVGKPFTIDQRARKVFLGSVPDAWLPREQDPDFHIDYVVELTEAGELTGINFGAQIKGFQPSGCPQFKYSLAVKHLKYYVDKVQFPVFLFLIDTGKGKILFRFMQAFAKELKSNWRAQKSVSVDFNEGDDFSDQLRFTNALAEAARYTRDLHPSSIEAALQKVKKDIESRDPRVEARVDIVNGVRRVSLTPKEPHSFEIKLNNISQSTKQAVVDFFEKGEDLSLPLNEIQFVGAPLFEGATSGEFQIAHRVNTDGHLLFVGSEPNDVPCHVQMPAIFWRGTKYISMEAQFPNTPMVIKGTFDPDRWHAAHPVTLTFDLDAGPWIGKSLGGLPYFDLLHSVVSMFVSRSVRLEMYAQGNFLAKADMTGQVHERLQTFLRWLSLIKKARVISKCTGVDAFVPPHGRIKRAEGDSIEELYGLLEDGSFRRDTPGVVLSGTLQGPENYRFQSGGSGEVKLELPTQDYKFFEKVVTVGPIEHLFTEMLISPAGKSDENGTPILFNGTAKSTQTIKLLNWPRTARPE